jgi:hypothetical protein
MSVSSAQKTAKVTRRIDLASDGERQFSEEDDFKRQASFDFAEPACKPAGSASLD